MTIQEAVDAFRRAAIQTGDFAEPANQDQPLEDMSMAWQVLEKNGPDGREALTCLLFDECPHVCTWVATQLLALGDERGIPVLEANVEVGGLIGFECEVVLSEWKAGNLKPPLGTVDA